METKSRLFIMLFIMNFCTFTTFGVALTFFPNISKLHGLSSIETGIIFSFYPVGGIVIGIILSKIMFYFQKENLLYFFLILLVLSVLAFGLAVFIDNKSIFILICILSRFFQGLSAGAYETIAYSYIPIIWPEDMEKKLGLLEISAGLGIGFGPVLGSFFYMLSGYFSIFLIQSFYIYFIGFYITYKYLSKINKDEENNSEEGKETIQIIEVFKNKDIIFLSLILCFVFTGITLIMTDFENHILELGGSIYLCSFLFLLGNIDYIISICFIKKMKKWYGKIALFNISIISIILSLFLIGIDRLFTFENNLYLFIIIGIGMFINGFGISIIIILFIPECINILNIILLSRVNKEQKSDFACGIFTSFLSLAELIGPILGGILADFVGFSSGCFIYGLFILCFFIIYIIFGNGFIGIKSLCCCNNDVKTKELKQQIIEID